MTHFYCLVAGSWMFVLGWYAGAIYMQNHNEQTERLRLDEIAKSERPRLAKIPEPCLECDAWRLPAAASASAD